jgi:hypothetical protein
MGKKWRYGKPAVGKNGKIKSAWVIVKGKTKEQYHRRELANIPSVPRFRSPVSSPTHHFP